MNKPINVAIGRSVKLDSVNKLKINVRPGDSCALTTVDNARGLQYKPGMLNFARFPCKFEHLNVRYTHFGGRKNVSDDIVKLLMCYESANETLIFPFSLVFKIIQVPFEIVQKCNTITVDSNLSQSSVIDHNVLDLSYNRAETICKISTVSRSTGLPQYGYLVNNSNSLTNLDCDTFFTMGIKYKHFVANSPKHDSIPMTVAIFSHAGDLLKQEYFHIYVSLIFGRENTKPEPAARARLVMHSINQFVMTVLTPEIISAVDAQTNSDRLLFLISQPLGPREGMIVNTDDNNIALSSFFQHEINDLKIAYKPPSSTSNIKHIFQLEVTIVDPEGLTSDPVNIMIVVAPMNTLAPIITTNTGIQLVEGQSRVIISPNVLEISDKDNLEEVKIYLNSGLRHGDLNLPIENAGKYFTPKDLQTGMVVYHHDGSDSLSDNIIFNMTDGTHSVHFLFPVTIFPKDDHSPLLYVNTALELKLNDIAEISQYALRAGDEDTEDNWIMFVLEAPFSKTGHIVKRQLQVPEDVAKWLFIDGMYEKVVINFTQKDIFDGRVFYKNIGLHQEHTVVDKINFRLIDSGSPPNKSPVYTFMVKNFPKDNMPPHLYPNTELRLEMDQYKMTTFRRKNLRYSDDETSEKDLKYIITKQPFDTYSQGPLDAGIVVNCGSHALPISNFTQAEINQNKICYQPPKMEFSIISRIIQFEFYIQDLSGNMLRNQKYDIIIKPINNQPPNVTNTGALLYENKEVIIMPQLLDVQDIDTDVENISFIVTRLPRFGVVYNQGHALSVGDSFVRKDIVQGHIFYKHLGRIVEAKDDYILLVISDGIHNIPINFKITIRPSDDEPAVLKGNAQDSKVDIFLWVNEKKMVILRPEHFAIADTDSNAIDIVYTIKQHPKYGRILKNRQRTSNFTRMDILSGKVEYEHTSGDIGRNKYTDFVGIGLGNVKTIILKDGSFLKTITLHITILPVDDIHPIIIIGNNVHVLEGNKSRLMPMHFNVHDADSNEESILCMITTQPKFGYIEDVLPIEGSDKSPISAFTVKHMRQGSVFYVQSVHKGIEAQEDEFILQCSDGVNISPQSQIHVQIQPVNDEMPEIVIRELKGSEGMDVRIDLAILNATDKDSPPSTLYFIITKQPMHGLILKHTESGDITVTNFTLDDIKDSSTVIYKHDNSETQFDRFEFVLTDGVHNVTQTVRVMIYLVDDETPRLTTNNGLKIETVSDRAIITNEVLKADDIDSYVGNITFIIKLLPLQGYLNKNFGIYRKNLTLGSNFTQTDIDNGVIEYVHTGQEAVKRDLIKFDVTDGINQLVDCILYITIKGVDVVYQEVINQGVRLLEGGVITLTIDILNVTDVNSPNENLKFKVIKLPTQGHLDFLDKRGIPISQFTQTDLAANRVRYVHDDDDEVKMDSFKLEVSDGLNSVLRTFHIAITDADNKVPIVMFTILRLKEGGSKFISPSELKVMDMDTSSDKIIFTITQVPQHGNILYNFSRIVSRFSLNDIQNNLISYQHDGTETFSDSFSFTVTDGIHTQFYLLGLEQPTRKPQQMDIEIIQDANGLPSIAVNTGTTYLSVLDVDSVGFQFTSRNLRCNDFDSPVDSLVFILTALPQHGYLRNVEKGNGYITSWSQGDLDRQQIQYILNPRENATSDIFFFKVTDRGGNSLANQPFHLNWGWVSFQENHITVLETQGAVDVVLQRRGFLEETCFVTINVKEKTAIVGKDVSRQFSQQVQFNPGQTTKLWRLSLRDDAIFEKEETLMLHLTDPVSVVLEYPNVVRLTILDPEDESTVFFPEAEMSVAENASQIEIAIHRTGDLSQELGVICSTREGTARGTPPGRVPSSSDYITRPDNHDSVIRFDKEENKTYCTVTIIDDSLFEEEEKFYVMLSQPMGGKIGNNSDVTILIQPDIADEPKFYFDQMEYIADESITTLDIKVWKTGTDLSRPSSVTVKSRKSEPPSAEANVDYIPVSRILDFSPGEMTQTLRVTINDDLGQPELEGIERFELHLRAPVGGSIGEPSVALVIINDTLSDLPLMEFAAAEYVVMETEKQLIAVITRAGDIRFESWVRCYTRHASAQGDIDYIERIDSNASLVFFASGEREAECRVTIIDDSHLEGEETFRLILGVPDSTASGGAILGGQTTTKIVILDTEDSPMIQLEYSFYTINEPLIIDDISILRINVIRLGDQSGTSEVSVSTTSGTAVAGSDFNPYFKVLRFEPSIEKVTAEIEIKYDNERENSEMFTVHLSADHLQIAKVKHNDKAIVYIEEKSKLADVSFPVQPIVVSLSDLAVNRNPIPGYPLICISPCSSTHPKHKVVSQICKQSGINDTLTKYRWRVGLPEVHNSMVDLDTNTVLTATRHVTLNSIYFTRGSQVQCFARAVNLNGEAGRETGSSIVTIDIAGGICRPERRSDTVTHTARMHYVEADDPLHQNTVRLTIQMPHTDGMLPVISTTRLSNVGLALSQDGFRLSQHKCSNLLDATERATIFASNFSRMFHFLDDAKTFSNSDTLQPMSTLEFFRNLDLESCVWTFETYYSISDLVNHCGGSIEVDDKVQNVKQSYVTLKVPLYVSYVYFAPGATATWRHIVHSMPMKLKFVYYTATPWQKGLTLIQDNSNVKGQMFLTNLSVNGDGKLVVGIRTVASFKGYFVLNNSDSSIQSTIKAVKLPDMSFFVHLISSNLTSDQPMQMWQFTSAVKLNDFSGDYKVSMLPCLVNFTQHHNESVPCPAHDFVMFDLPIRLQQVTDSVPPKFSLNTQFYLTRKMDVWLSENIAGQSKEEDCVFAKGDTIYGRVSVDPVQALNNQFTLCIVKVFLCSGKDGYVPKYNPDHGENGCVDVPDKLDKVFRILDIDDQDTVDSGYQGMPFRALSAKEDPYAKSLMSQREVDGFSFDASPLFQFEEDKQWFIHVIYSIHLKNNKGVVKLRSDFTSLTRSAFDIAGVGNVGIGTNMALLILDFNGTAINEGIYHSDNIAESEQRQTSLLSVLIGVGILLLIGIFVLVIFIRHRRKRTSPPPSPSGTITVMSASAGQTRVISVAHNFKKTDQSEV